MHNKYLFWILGFLAFYSCELDPIADVKPECQITALFTPSPLSCPAPCTVSINENSTVSNSCEADFLWDFGDGNFSAAESPGSYTYDEVGNYNLCLTIQETSDVTNMDSTCVTIVVFNPAEPPVAVIEPSMTNCFGPCSISFRGSNSLRAINYHWDFGDGETSTEPNVEHIFAPAHTPYNVTLTVTNMADDSIDVETIQINANWRTFEEDFQTEDLGLSWGLLPTADTNYVMVGTEQLGALDFGIYSLLAGPDGTSTGDPCIFPQKSEFDFVFDAVMLSNGEVAAVGSTLNDVNATNNDILLLNYNPFNPCGAEPERLGDDNRREEGRALIEDGFGPGGIEVAVVGEVIENNRYFVYFQRLNLSGLPAGGEELSEIQGDGLLIADVVKAPNGHYWVCGQTNPLGGDPGQALLVHLNGAGQFVEHFAYGDAARDDQFQSLTISNDGTHVLACGFSFQGSGQKDMIYLRANLSSPSSAVLQRLNTAPVGEARSIFALDNGQVLVGGAGGNGCTLQLMTETGNVLKDNSFGTASTDFFNVVTSTLDGGFAAAGVKGGRLFLVKTDDVLSL